ncbi:MAG: hypothetical protein GY861_13770 [bacterium]|nr:hypothetical protein [bacterium]
MGKINQSLDQIGFSFSDLNRSEIAERDRIHRRIKEIHRLQRKLHVYATMFRPLNVEELRNEFRELSKEAVSLGAKSWKPKEKAAFGIYEK